MAKSILIVEDDNNIADLLRLYLEKEGYQATIAADGTQGIDLYRKLRPDLVLLDVIGDPPCLADIEPPYEEQSDLDR